MLYAYTYDDGIAKVSRIDVSNDFNTIWTYGFDSTIDQKMYMMSHKAFT